LLTEKVLSASTKGISGTVRFDTENPDKSGHFCFLLSSKVLSDMMESDSLGVFLVVYPQTPTPKKEKYSAKADHAARDGKWTATQLKMLWNGKNM